MAAFVRDKNVATLAEYTPGPDCSAVNRCDDRLLAIHDGIKAFTHDPIMPRIGAIAWRLWSAPQVAVLA